MEYDYYAVYCEAEPDDSIIHDYHDQWEMVRAPKGTPFVVVCGRAVGKKAQCGHGQINWLEPTVGYVDADYDEAEWQLDLTPEIEYAKLLEEQAEMAKVQDRLI